MGLATIIAVAVARAGRFPGGGATAAASVESDSLPLTVAISVAIGWTVSIPAAVRFGCSVPGSIAAAGFAGLIRPSLSAIPVAFLAVVAKARIEDAVPDPWRDAVVVVVIAPAVLVTALAGIMTLDSGVRADFMVLARNMLGRVRPARTRDTRNR